MKNKQLCAIQLFLVAVIVFFCFFGCEKPSDDDLFSISSITVYNIPATIPVRGNSAAPVADTYKVYFFASDEMTNKFPPKAKAAVKVTSSMLQSNGTYTVNIPLGNPSPYFKGDPEYLTDEYGPNPNLDFGSWSGTAKFYSLAISPDNTLVFEENAIWMRGGYDLNTEVKNLDWNSTLNFRVTVPGTPPGSNLDFALRTKEFFNDIICFDPDIDAPEPEISW